MKKILFLFLIYIYSSLFAKEPIITTSIIPLYDIIQNITQNIDKVYYLVPKNQNPHTFSLAPAQMKIINKTDLFFFIGFGFEEWLNNISINKKKIVYLDKFIIPISETKNKKSANPHYWLSPKEVIICSSNIYKILVSHYPENKNIYKKNYEIFIKKLKSIDNKYKQTLKKFKNISFIESHPIMDYIARDYNLKIKGVIYKNPGTQPKPKDILNLLKITKKNLIDTVIIKEGFNKNKIDNLFDSKFKNYIYINPIAKDSNSIIELLEYNLKNIKNSINN